MEKAIYKAPMRKENARIWNEVIDESIAYLVGLKDANNVPLLQHRRKTFIVGLVIAAKSARELAKDLLCREDNPYKYVTNYKWS